MGAIQPPDVPSHPTPTPAMMATRVRSTMYVTTVFARVAAHLRATMAIHAQTTDAIQPVDAHFQTQTLAATTTMPARAMIHAKLGTALAKRLSSATTAIPARTMGVTSHRAASFSRTPTRATTATFAQQATLARTARALQTDYWAVTTAIHAPRTPVTQGREAVSTTTIYVPVETTAGVQTDALQRPVVAFGSPAELETKVQISARTASAVTGKKSRIRHG